MSVYVLLDGAKHPTKKNVRYYNLANVLKTKKKLGLEHTVVGKLLRWPVIGRKKDGYDIAVALASP